MQRRGEAAQAPLPSQVNGGYVFWREHLADD